MGIFSWFSSIRYPEEPRWLRRLVFPAARHNELDIHEIEKDEELEQVKRAAAEDVAEIEKEDRRYFRQDGPEHLPEDDL